MFSKKITMEEFAHGIYLAGIAQYNQFLNWFREKEIAVDYKNLVYIVGLINAKMVDKVLVDEKIIIKGNLDKSIIKELKETVPEDMTKEENEEAARYVQTAYDRINEIINKDNGTILDTINYFLFEVTTEMKENKEIVSDIEYLFKEWQNMCYDLIKKFKIEE